MKQFLEKIDQSKGIFYLMILIGIIMEVLCLYLPFSTERIIFTILGIILIVRGTYGNE